MTSDTPHPLRAEVRAMPLRDGPEFLRWLAAAARLHALGDPSELARWSGVRKKLRLALGPLVIEHAAAGIAELRGGAGPLLAAAVLRAQDFAVFAAVARDELPRDVLRALDEWRLGAEETLLDADAADHLREQDARYPIARDSILPIVAHPLTVEEDALLAALAPSVVTVSCDWDGFRARRPERPGRSEERPAASVAFPRLGADDRFPADPGEERRRYARTMTTIVPDLGRLDCSRRMDRHGGIIVAVRAPRRVLSVRIGPLAGEAMPEKDEWLIHARHIPEDRRRAVVLLPLVLRFDHGLRLEIRES